LIRDALKFEILLILIVVRFTTFSHHHRIMTHFWPPAEGCKQRAIIFYGGQVIANFVPKFVAMATGVGREKI